MQRPARARTHPAPSMPRPAVRGDLIRILNKLMRRRNKFDHIIIETTGLANPAPVIQASRAAPGVGPTLRAPVVALARPAE